MKISAFLCRSRGSTKRSHFGREAGCRTIPTAPGPAKIRDNGGADRQGRDGHGLLHARPSRTFRTATSFAPRACGSSSNSLAS